ncbi:Transcriptional regulator, Xre family [hydrothermal vent metagenome]|uniref:Transcriptional regulator, Xre family n=1 Tax=hydrothermal vent metagenome TaxID=652676 RepID=A0A3B0RII0_9ZZZZ
MTPFGEHIRELRAKKQVTMKEMAKAIGVSSAYLSALEHGNRGRPSWYLLQRTISYFNIIWDDAEELVKLARLSHPRITIDTSGLSPKATELANRLADDIAQMSEQQLSQHLSLMSKADLENKS